MIKNGQRKGKIRRDEVIKRERKKERERKREREREIMLLL